MSEYFCFNSNHNVILIDRKGFAKTIAYVHEHKPVDRYIYVAEPATCRVPVEFKFNNKKIPDEPALKKLVFEFYRSEYGRSVYREVGYE